MLPVFLNAPLQKKTADGTGLSWVSDLRDLIWQRRAVCRLVCGRQFSLDWSSHYEEGLQSDGQRRVLGKNLRRPVRVAWMRRRTHRNRCGVYFHTQFLYAKPAMNYLPCTFYTQRRWPRKPSMFLASGSYRVAHIPHQISTSSCPFNGSSEIKSWNRGSGNECPWWFLCC